MTRGQLIARALPLKVIALSSLTNPAAIVAVIAPAMVNSLVANGRLPVSAAALVGAAELAGMTLALLLGPSYVGTASPRRLTLGAIGTAIIAHLLSLIVAGVGPIALARAAAGASEGVVYAVAVASLAATAAPDRAFGVMITVNHAVSTVILALLAWIVLHASGLGPGGVIVGFLLLTCPFVIALQPPTSKHQADTGVSHSAKVGLIPAAGGLAAVFLLSLGFGVVWPLVGQIARFQGIDAGVIARSLSIAGMGGVAGGLAAALLGIRLGRLQPLVLASLAFAFALVLPTYPVAFASIAFAILFFWTLSLPYYLGLVSWFDRTGALAVATSAMIPCGIAVGQATAGSATRFWSYDAICLAGCGAVVCGALAALIADRAFRLRAYSPLGAR